jgi:hypothetical protein
MKKNFESDYSRIISRAVANKKCNVKVFKKYAFIKCEDKAFFVQNLNGKGEGFLLENEKEKDFFRKLYKLFKPESIEVI